MKNLFRWLVALVLFMVILAACKIHYFRNHYQDSNTLLHDSKGLQKKLFLKAHMKNGDICILEDTWVVDTSANSLKGKGTRYNYNRQLTFQGSMTVPIDSISIFETNKELDHIEKGRMATLGILTGLDVLLGAICLINPKACFGSCPTFYFNDDDHLQYSEAEGFSNAIAPSLEYTDIDALGYKWVQSDELKLIMKNEALETHCVKDLRVMAYPRIPGEQVFHSRTDAFYRVDALFGLTYAEGPEGDITHILQKPDKEERSSLADDNNLRSRESIILEFDDLNINGTPGLVLNFRQSLMTTYLIYSALGYMGDQVGDFFAMIENDRDMYGKINNGLKKELGEIDIYLWNPEDDRWEYQGGYYETGPIAFNKQILPLNPCVTGNQLKLKIVQNKGLWRLDYAAIGNIVEEVQPQVLLPFAVKKGNVPDEQSLVDLLNPEKHMISMPGESFSIFFKMPEENQGYDLFLSSTGYYLEWMRSSWIQDKDLLKLRQMFEKPRKYLKDEAKAYKKYEETMEEQFWNSKIETQKHTYYEKL